MLGRKNVPRYKPSKELLIRRIRRLIGLDLNGPPKNFTKSELKEIVIFLEQCRDIILNIPAGMEQAHGVEENRNERSHKEANVTKGYLATEAEISD